MHFEVFRCFLYDNLVRRYWKLGQSYFFSKLYTILESQILRMAKSYLESVNLENLFSESLNS